MMCQVLRVEDPRAIPHAIDLGIGMQLTNIARDVKEDAGRGRVYIPATVLSRVGLSSSQILDGTADPEKLAQAVQWLYETGEAYYQSAEEGMRFIPWRSRLAIYVASRTYRGIGVKLARNGFNAMAGRTIVPWFEKMFWVGHGLTSAIRSLFASRYVQHKPKLHESLRELPGANRG